MTSKRKPDSIKELSKITKEEWREFTRNVWSIANTSHQIHPAVFPEEIPHRLIKLFTFWGETVLDPFAGIGTTAAAALKAGRRAICIEQNPAYVNLIKNELSTIEAQTLIEEHESASGVYEKRLSVRRGDSGKILCEFEDESVELIVTSPPYWNKADYGSRSENIGNIERYSEFIAALQPIFVEGYRILKPGRKACIVTANVNQYTDLGLLTFPLAADIIVMMRHIGFVLVNDIIWTKDGTGGRWGSWGNQRPIFGSYPYPPNFLFKNVYEHIIVFEKPNRAKKRGKKAKSMKDIM